MEREDAIKTMRDLLASMVEKKSSDMFITDGFPPAMKIDGKIVPVGEDTLLSDDTKALCSAIMNDRQVKEFEATKGHETIHATGAKHRLDRTKGKRFGDEAYAYEELVAELGAAMLCSHVGIPLERLQHTQYIHGWLKRLKSDKKFLFNAAADAGRAFNYLVEDQT